MLIISEAKIIAENFVAELSAKDNIEFRLWPDGVVESEFCFAFNFVNEKYLRTGNIMDMLLGHGPILIDKRNGAVVTTGSARDVDYYIENYEKRGDPFRELGVDVLIVNWEAGAFVISAVKCLRAHTGLGLAKAKRIIEECLSGEECAVQARDVAGAIKLVQGLKECGFIAKHI